MRRTITFQFIPIILALSACDPMRSDFPDVSNAVSYQSSNLISASASNSPRVMSWNIKFGGARIDFFFDCFGDRVLMSEDEVTANMAALASHINSVDPDILFLQEVDVLSKRAAYVDQVQYLLDNTNLNYGAYASQWRSDFVPSDGIGKVNSGNAILSKWPINNAKRHSLPLIASQDSLVQYFYLRRNYLQAEIAPNGSDKLTLIATHTSAYAQDDTRQQQLQRIHAAARAISDAGGDVLVGGDFNTLPPFESTFRTGFTDVVCTDPDFQGGDYSGEETWIQPFYDDFSPLITEVAYTASPASHWTYTADKNGSWNRKLDYLFTNSGNSFASATTDQATMSLSDHAPIYATLTYAP
ncbi:MAG: endonuclease/exonuclease/phosphatase family protein [Gammaproteobacteria bacterium]|nr:endonuclease/exonuclease/phosphatase family protein [Gammaproteobacteria bacterium]